MGCFFVLRVAWLLTRVEAAVVFPPTILIARERAFIPSPGGSTGFFRRVGLQLSEIVALKDVLPFVADDLLAFLAAITGRKYRDTARAAKTRMACLIAKVLSAWQQITADLVAAETGDIVRVDASLLRGMLAAKARLDGAHERARRTWA